MSVPQGICFFPFFLIHIPHSANTHLRVCARFPARKCCIQGASELAHCLPTVCSVLARRGASWLESKPSGRVRAETSELHSTRTRAHPNHLHSVSRKGCRFSNFLCMLQSIFLVGAILCSRFASDAPINRAVVQNDGEPFQSDINFLTLCTGS